MEKERGDNIKKQLEKMSVERVKKGWRKKEIKPNREIDRMAHKGTERQRGQTEMKEYKHSQQVTSSHEQERMKLSMITVVLTERKEYKHRQQQVTSSRGQQRIKLSIVTVALTERKEYKHRQQQVTSSRGQQRIKLSMITVALTERKEYKHRQQEVASSHGQERIKLNTITVALTLSMNRRQQVEKTHSPHQSSAGSVTSGSHANCTSCSYNFSNATVRESCNSPFRSAP